MRSYTWIQSKCRLQNLDVGVHMFPFRLSFVASFMVQSSTVKNSNGDSMHSCLTPDCTADWRYEGHCTWKCAIVVKSLDYSSYFRWGSAQSQKFPFFCNNCYTKRQNSIKHIALVIIVQLIRRGRKEECKIQDFHGFSIINRREKLSSKTEIDSKGLEAVVYKKDNLSH